MAGCALSVNLNKIALVRNSRGGDRPAPVAFARTALTVGAAGITVHPRPDLRHIRPDDVAALASELADHWPGAEFNIEGNPLEGPAGDYPGYLELVRRARPAQATLVPDTAGQLTSDHGFLLDAPTISMLVPIVDELHALGCRVSLFMDPDPSAIERVPATGADRIELYTGPYAQAHQAARGSAAASALTGALELHARAADAARRIGLGVNAGHDLDQDNLTAYVAAVGPSEVSIGHALVSDALEAGFAPTVAAYLTCLEAAGSRGHTRRPS